MYCDTRVSLYVKLFSDSDRDTIVEVSRNISLASVGVAFAAGLFYFVGVKRSVYVP